MDSIAEGPLNGISNRIKKSTNTIDIGDDILASDNDRAVWDFLDGVLMR